MGTPDIVTNRIGIAKHWLGLADTLGGSPQEERAQKTAARMGRNECAWLLHQDHAGVIRLGDEDRRELESLVIRHSPSHRDVQFTSFEGLPVYTSAITASLL